jgi:hypothetical protein
MNAEQFQHITAKLFHAVEGDDYDAELILDAYQALVDLWVDREKKIDDLEAIISNQRAEIQRMRVQDGVW